MPRIGIIGGGITGLTAAYELSKRDFEVLVIEEEERLGGQAGTFRYGETCLEKFYHHLFASDKDIIALAGELGLRDRLQWHDSRTGVFHNGKIYPFVSPVDLMRFEPLGLLDRIRLGLIYLYLRRLKDWRRLEPITAREWIVRHGSQRIYDVLWGPLLRGKFAGAADQISMTWLWGKIHLRGGSRSKAMTKEKLGYFDGSFQILIDALAKAIEQRNGEILTGTRVTRVLVHGEQVRGLELTPAGGAQTTAASKTVACDGVIATVPSHRFLSLAPELPIDYVRRLRQVCYQTAVCVILELRKPLSDIYWLNISDDGFPFVGVIEHTNFVPSERYSGTHIAYITNYVAPSDALLGLSAAETVRRYIPYLRQINPKFEESWIKGYRLYRDDGGQPIVTTGYAQAIPPHLTPVRRLYLANTSQIYPEDRGTNYSVRLGKLISEIVNNDN